MSEWPFIVIYSKISVYPDKMCHLQLNSRQIILFRLKSHHFWTYFLYMIRYNNASRPSTTPKSRVRDTPNPQDWRLCFYPQNFLMTFFSHRKLQQNNYAATMASAAHQQIIGGASTNYRRRRADQQKSVAAAPTNCRRRRGRRMALFWAYIEYWK